MITIINDQTSHIDILALTIAHLHRMAENEFYQPSRDTAIKRVSSIHFCGITLDSSHARRDLISGSRGVGDTRKQGMFLQLFA